MSLSCSLKRGLRPFAQLDAPRLAQALQQLGLDRVALLPRAERARALARPDAAAQLLARCLAHVAEAA